MPAHRRNTFDFPCFRILAAGILLAWLGGTSLGDVLPDTPYEAARERVLTAAGPSPKDGSDR